MYASVQDCRASRGDRPVDLLRDESGTDGPLERALADATALIDSYAGTRHPVPLDPVPPIVATYCIDIAMYRAAPDAALATDHDRQRYEDALRFLRDVSKGAVSLGWRDPDPPAGADGPAVSIDAPGRVMASDSLKGVL